MLFSYRDNRARVWELFVASLTCVMFHPIFQQPESVRRNIYKYAVGIIKLLNRCSGGAVLALQSILRKASQLDNSERSYVCRVL